MVKIKKIQPFPLGKQDSTIETPTPEQTQVQISYSLQETPGYSQVKGVLGKVGTQIFNLYMKLFGEKKPEVEGVQLNAEDQQIAYLTHIVYFPPSDRLEEYGDWELDTDLNQILHCVYVHKTEPRVLISYRGTDFTDIKDISSDVQIVLGVNSIDQRIGDSLSFYDDVNVKYPQHQKWICGHSLGGTICFIVMRHRNAERAIVFNPGSAPNRTFITMINENLMKRKWTRKITTYKIFGDVVSTCSFIGQWKTFYVKSLNPGELHSISTFSGINEKDYLEHLRK